MGTCSSRKLPPPYAGKADAEDAEARRVLAAFHALSFEERYRKGTLGQTHTPRAHDLATRFHGELVAMGLISASVIPRQRFLPTVARHVTVLGARLDEARIRALYDPTHTQIRALYAPHASN